MRILVYGAGNIGCLYAARLAEAGHQVTILARGQRLVKLKERGIRLIEYKTGLELNISVPVAECLDPDDEYDMILVILPRHRLSEALPTLASNRHASGFLFFGNNAAGTRELVEAVGTERVLLGFPGAAAVPEDDHIRYLICHPMEQPTTIGELNSFRSERIQAIAAAFKGAGFPVSICPRMDAWLKTHAFKIVPTVLAMFMAGGDHWRLSQDRDALALMHRAIREGFSVLSALDIPITPSGHRFLQWLPEPILVLILKRMIASDETAIKFGHADAGCAEWQTLADQLQALSKEAHIPTPYLDRLYQYLGSQSDSVTS